MKYVNDLLRNPNIILFLNTNLNKRNIKYKSYPKSRKINAFGQSKCIFHSLNDLIKRKLINLWIKLCIFHYHSLIFCRKNKSKFCVQTKGKRIIFFKYLNALIYNQFFKNFFVLHHLKKNLSKCKLMMYSLFINETL